MKGDLEEAYKGFTELLEMYPRDPLYKYYSGVCLVKLEKNPVEALALLEQAHGGSSVVRSIPGDLLFWLGRARQMTGDYEKAIEAFDGYTIQFGKKAAKDLDIPAYIQQCREQKG
ncbi:MAG TPA: tetratricopeptide repeat protein, partial [Bacteroidales bacterium]|nr:tetratricopeptide repeat protein [Bacteroidales bacterium]